MKLKGLCKYYSYLHKKFPYIFNGGWVNIYSFNCIEKCPYHIDHDYINNRINCKLYNSSFRRQKLKKLKEILK